MMKKCNLCGFPIVTINKTVFGRRCIKCRSTFIHRAMGMVLSNMVVPDDAKVHEFSHHGAIFNYLKKRFSQLSTSEYFDDTPIGQCRNGIQCQDIQQLTFEDNSFDLMTSTEVFEHIPDDYKAFREVWRCLKPDGYFVFTVPLEKTPHTVERAKLINGKIEHYLEPEYHGDHLRKQGILAFRNYGLDIHERLINAGFSEVELCEIEDPEFAITPMKIVIKARK